MTQYLSTVAFADAAVAGNADADADPDVAGDADPDADADAGVATADCVRGAGVWACREVAGAGDGAGFAVGAD